MENGHEICNNSMLYHFQSSFITEFHKKPVRKENIINDMITAIFEYIIFNLKIVSTLFQYHTPGDFKNGPKTMLWISMHILSWYSLMVSDKQLAALLALTM